MKTTEGLMYCSPTDFRENSLCLFAGGFFEFRTDALIYTNMNDAMISDDEIIFRCR